MSAKIIDAEEYRKARIGEHQSNVLIHELNRRKAEYKYGLLLWLQLYVEDLKAEIAQDRWEKSS